jgi:cobyrinic acid a,c-diamide synthase
VVLDAERLRRGFSLPRPAAVDGVLIDKVADQAEARRFQTTIEALWGAPVLGSLEPLPQIRAAIGGLSRGCAPSRELCRTLGENLLERLHFERLCNLAGGRQTPPGSSQLFDEPASARPLKIAVAFDEVFRFYFPDTLDLLEARGAVLRDFSPVHDERLPQRTDVVYFGCGLPELSAHSLASNHCMKQSIRAFARAGGRIFAECGGLAYLCEQIVMPCGRCVPMTGVLPATARVNPSPSTPRPVEVTLEEDTWLGREGTRLRGYQNTNYKLHSSGGLPSLVRELKHRADLLGDGRVIASRIHINFAAHADLLARFFRPLRQRAAVS